MNKTKPVCEKVGCLYCFPAPTKRNRKKTICRYNHGCCLARDNKVFTPRLTNFVIKPPA